MSIDHHGLWVCTHMIKEAVIGALLAEWLVTVETSGNFAFLLVRV